MAPVRSIYQSPAQPPHIALASIFNGGSISAIIDKSRKLPVGDFSSHQAKSGDVDGSLDLIVIALRITEYSRASRNGDKVEVLCSAPNVGDKEKWEDGKKFDSQRHSDSRSRLFNPN